MKRSFLTFAFFLSLLGLSACVSADPAVVARAVNATLTAVPTPTPIVVVVTLPGQAIVIPTVTPAPSATPQSSPIPTPEATPTLGSSVTLGASIIKDDFSDPSRWVTSDDELQRTAIEAGVLTLTLKQSDQFTLAYNNTQLARDFYVSVVAGITGPTTLCAERDRYGLLFRVHDASNYYQFQVDCEGRYRVVAVVDGELKTLRDWTTSEAILPGGEANTLGVRAQGTALEVFANHQLLAEMTDATFLEGGFGLYAGSGPQSQMLIVTFDDLNVWELK